MGERRRQGRERKREVEGRRETERLSSNINFAVHKLFHLLTGSIFPNISKD